MPGSMDSLNSHEKLWTDMEYMQLTFDRMKEMKDKGYIQDTFLSDSYADAQERCLPVRRPCIHRQPGFMRS